MALTVIGGNHPLKYFWEQFWAWYSAREFLPVSLTPEILHQRNFCKIEISSIEIQNDWIDRSAAIKLRLLRSTERKLLEWLHDNFFCVLDSYKQ